jgi:YD repeat-containing protein
MINFNKTNLNIVVFLLLCSIVNAEDYLPKILPQSPVAAEYTRYGDIPVSIATGVPSIEIPLYTLTSKTLSIPISISYHASGIKVNDVSSEVGLGWVLNAGGVLTSTVMGTRDMPNTIVGHNHSEFLYLNSDQIYDDWYDGLYGASANERTRAIFVYSLVEYGKNCAGTSGNDFFSDRYYYSLPNGEAGIFRQNFMTEEFIPIPFSPVKIKPIVRATVYRDFEITTSDGTSFSFQDPFYLSDKYIPVRIVSSDKLDSINFYVHSVPGQYHYMYNRTFWDKDEIYTRGCDLSTRPLTTGGVYHVPSKTSFNEILIDSIISSTTVVKFVYYSDRQDWKSLIPNRLREIQILSRSTRSIIKTINFNQSYFGTAGEKDARLKLTDIQTIYGAQNETYSFKYNSLELPDYSNLPEIYKDRAYFDDFWGYYNGIEKSIQIPYPFYSDGANKFPNRYYAQACILKEIDYPTGGKTIFEYESNKVDSGFYDLVDVDDKPTDGTVGGLRIKKISSYSDNNSEPKVKEYEYSVDSHYAFKLQPSMFIHTQKKSTSFYHYCGFALLLNLVSTDYTICEASGFKPLIGIDRLLSYSQVAEYNGSIDSNNGKTIYYYRLPERAEIGYDYYSPQLNSCRDDIGIIKPILWKQDAYKLENKEFKLVQETINSFDRFKIEEFQTGLNFSFDLELSVDATDPRSIKNSDPLELYIYYLASAMDYYESIYYEDTKAYTDCELVTQTEDRSFIDNNTYVSAITKYTYNNNLQLASKTLMNSDNRTVVTCYKYPSDFSSAVYDSMVARNIISPVIEKTTTQGSSSESIMTNYYNPSSMIIVPHTVQQIVNSSIDTRLTYNSYDTNGNITQYSGADGLVTTIIWGYGKTYPVAKIISGSSITVPESIRDSINNHRFYGTDAKSQINSDITYMAGKLSTYVTSDNYQVSFYTYMSLVGITSETLFNGKTISEPGTTTYYIYDDYGRLSEIQDDDGHLLKKYTYNYAKN